MIEIDGNLGEAGGQILRTALSLSCLLRRPFRIFNIRKRRSRPGLMPQHLMCVHALARVSHATVRGNHPGSMDLVFEPGETTAGTYFFDIGTAGSTSLLLQALLPPLLFCNDPTWLTLQGGTHVPFSPPFQYISEVFIPSLARLGFRLRADIETYGFYPRGGGVVKIEIDPVPVRLSAFLALRRGTIQHVRGVSGVGNLPQSIGDRQRKAAKGVLSQKGITGDIESISVPAVGQGTFVFIGVETAECNAGFSSLGERGKKAETVGIEAADKALSFLSTDACLDPYLADQIVAYLSLVPGESAFSTSSLSDHLLTNLRVVDRFLGISCRVTGDKGGPGYVKLKGKGFPFSLTGKNREE